MSEAVFFCNICEMAAGEVGIYGGGAAGVCAKVYGDFGYDRGYLRDGKVSVGVAEYGWRVFGG